MIRELIDDSKIAFSFILTPQQKPSKLGWSEQKPGNAIWARDPEFIFDTQTQTQSTNGKKITRARARKIQRSTERESALMAVR